MSIATNSMFAFHASSRLSSQSVTGFAARPLTCTNNPPAPVMSTSPVSQRSTHRRTPVSEQVSHLAFPRRVSSIPNPKLRRPGCVDSWLTRGFAGLVGWWFWLRGGQGYRGANEVESAALVGGGFGEGGHLGVGAVVADLVAGEGGQVIE